MPQTTDPLRKVVSDRYSHREGGILILECGHEVRKDLGRKYGKSTRCHRCSQVPAWIEAMDNIRGYLDQADHLLAEGKLANDSLLWSTTFELERRLREAIERVASAEQG